MTEMAMSRQERAQGIYVKYITRSLHDVRQLRGERERGSWCQLRVSISLKVRRALIAAFRAC